MQPDGRIDARELVQEGYVQEVNRRFFHPLGLALAVRLNGDNEAYAYVLDYRDDPEGVRFDDSLDLEAKAGHINEIWLRRVGPRLAELGYVIQPRRASIH